MKALYVAIVEQIQAELGSHVFVDLWNGQLERQKQISVPAVLVELQVPEYRKNRRGVQDGRAQITVRVVQEIYEDTSGNTPDAELDKALEVLDFVEQVYVALQLLQGDSFAKLERTSTTYDPEYTHHIVHSISFSTMLHDTAKEQAENAKLVKVAPDLMPEKAS